MLSVFFFDNFRKKRGDTKREVEKKEVKSTDEIKI